MAEEPCVDRTTTPEPSFFASCSPTAEGSGALCAGYVPLLQRAGLVIEAEEIAREVHPVGSGLVY